MKIQGSRLENKQYEFVSRFPRLQQTQLAGSIVYLAVSLIVSLIYFSFIAADLRSDSIPSSAIYFSHCLLAFSGLATFYWFTRAANYFRAGALGYKVTPLPLILVFSVAGLFWAAPIFFDYRMGAALQSTASAADADSGYVFINRAASLLDAGSHLEPLGQGPEFSYLPGPDVFSASFIKRIGTDAVKPLDRFAPQPLKRLLASLFTEGLAGCAAVWGDLSREAQTNAIQQSNKAEAQAARLAALDTINASFERSRQQFPTCLDKIIVQTNIEKKEILGALATAQRNAYLVHIAYRMFGPHSSDYRDYLTRTNFAAPELKPFGLGDISVIAGIGWILFFLSVLYVAREYVDSSSLWSLLRTVFVVGSSLALFLLALDRVSPIPNNGNQSVYDVVASALHWPAMLLIPITMAWVIASWFFPSTLWTRSASLATFLCLPVFIAIESLNALNTFASTNYASCPSMEWFWLDQLHCGIYAVWQPTIRLVGDFLSLHLSWDAYWTTTAGRIGISSATSIILAWALAWPFLQLLKREYVRPRDK
jgi:hypothetical protein